MTVRPLALVLAGVAFLGLNQQASAQSCSGNPCSVTNTASVTVGTLLKLTLSSTTTGLTTPDTVAFNQGYQDDLSALTATVKANRGWTLNVKAGAATWTASGAGARANKPAGDLEWSTSGGAPFTALTTSAATLATSGSGTTGTTSTLSYRTLWNYILDTPGSYSLDVVYTLTSP